MILNKSIYNNRNNLIYFFKVGANNIGKNRIIILKNKKVIIKNLTQNVYKINLFIYRKNILIVILKI